MSAGQKRALGSTAYVKRIINACRGIENQSKECNVSAGPAEKGFGL